MAEYIEREAVLDTLAEGHGLRTADEEKVILDLWGKIKKLPAADVVEVVRCKDCEYWESGEDDEMYCNSWGNMMTDTVADDFCSYGERRNDA